MITAQLEPAYDRSAADRDAGEQSPWKLAERQAFLERLRAEGRTSLLEVGAGSGQDGLFFQEQGLVGPQQAGAPGPQVTRPDAVGSRMTNSAPRSSPSL